MDEGREKKKINTKKKYTDIIQLFDSYNKFLSGKIVNFFINIILSISTVIPFMLKLCQKVAFTYEVNDDAAIVQILDGSYTGIPDGHAIFIKYPLSWIIAKLYKVNPRWPFQIPADKGTNWYVTVIVVLEVFALTAVLFRILNYFRCNRILICFLYNIAFIYIWMPCFFHLTFSTVAAFLGCACLLFVGFAKKEELWRPWNLFFVGILGISAYCMRKQCFYMIIPFLLIEIWYKYRMDFFRSVKPWFIFVFCGVVGSCVLFLNAQMYRSVGWKKYFIYNHARAYMQDYTGMPDYKKNQEFYHSIGVSEAAQKALKNYSYCLYDDFSLDTIEKIYMYQKAQEPEVSHIQKMEKAKKRACRFCVKKNQAGEFLKSTGFYVWFLILPLIAVSLLFQWKEGLLKWSSVLIYGAGSAFFIYIEWVYLAMNGRFPQRVEECIRLLMLTAGVLLVCHLLTFWKNNSFIRVPVVLQILILAIFLHISGNGTNRIQLLQGIQAGREAGSKKKAEIAAYCGNHKENYYILDTQSFGKPSGVKDDLHQGNWFMSGSWTAHSPLYEEKLAKDGISSLGTEFLLKKNVYVITKGKKNVLNLLGQENTEHFTYKAVDEIETSGNLFFVVYKISTDRK